MPCTLYGGGFTPLQLAGLQGWWKADADAYNVADTTLATDGQTVAQWKDQSGNARHLVTTGSPPTWESNEINGLPILRSVAASSQELQTTGFTLADFVTAGAKTVFVVAKSTTGGILYANDNIAGQTAFGINGTPATLTVFGYDGTVDTASKGGLTSNPTIVTALHSSGNFYAGVTDTRTASMGSAASGDTSVLTQPLVVFRDRGTFGTHDIGEILIWNVALSESDRQSVERYLAARWGITLPY